MRPTAAVLVLFPFLLQLLFCTTAALKTPKWIEERRQMVLDRKTSDSFEKIEPREEAATLTFSSSRAEQYRVKDRLPDIDCKSRVLPQKQFTTFFLTTSAFFCHQSTWERVMPG
jgi:hypothetical protein